MVWFAVHCDHSWPAEPCAGCCRGGYASLGVESWSLGDNHIYKERLERALASRYLRLPSSPFTNFLHSINSSSHHQNGNQRRPPPHGNDSLLHHSLPLRNTHNRSFRLYVPFPSPSQPKAKTPFPPRFHNPPLLLHPQYSLPLHRRPNNGLHPRLLSHNLLYSRHNPLRHHLHHLRHPLHRRDDGSRDYQSQRDESL